MSKGSIIIAGTHSGAGKTTISIGIMAALRARGLNVQPFKVGPDFIDPAYHNHVTGVVSRNLDGWMMGRAALRNLYAVAGERADISVIEGAMGLYDGAVGGASAGGSTAEVARLTGAPAVLVVDARGMAGSAAAVVRGFETMDSKVNVAAVILNRVGSKRHAELLKRAIGKVCRARVAGMIPVSSDVDIPSRHLGLTTDVAGILTPKFLGRLTRLIEENVDIALLLKIASKADRIKPADGPKNPSRRPAARLAVAMDEAFCFYYPDNLELLESCGLDIVPFSPLKDGGLPEGVRGIYIGGGYPEMYARGLAMNDFVKGDVMAAAGAGMPIYAECGGLMYLSRGIRDAEGVYHPMVGLFPARASMLQRKKALGYREVRITADGTPFPKGGRARGHEFHYSEMEPMPDSVGRAYAVKGLDGVEFAEGYTAGGALGSYVHLHFLSNRAFARSFAHRVSGFNVPFKRV